MNKQIQKTKKQSWTNENTKEYGLRIKKAIGEIKKNRKIKTLVIEYKYDKTIGSYFWIYIEGRKYNSFSTVVRIHKFEHSGKLDFFSTWIELKNIFEDVLRVLKL